ncbi:MAG: hypothetical protein ACR2MS_10290 [Weeksellaceae bacterium]
MKLFFKNYHSKIGIPMGRALDASVWQALEIYDNLPENDDSFIGFINEKKEVLKIVKYNKFLWLVEIPEPELGGSHQGYFTRRRCRMIIEKVFNNIQFKDLPGLNFEKYL